MREFQTKMQVVISLLFVRSRGWVAVNKKQVNPDPGLKRKETSGRTNVKEAKQQSFKRFIWFFRSISRKYNLTSLELSVINNMLALPISNTISICDQYETGNGYSQIQNTNHKFYTRGFHSHQQRVYKVQNGR